MSSLSSSWLLPYSLLQSVQFRFTVSNKHVLFLTTSRLFLTSWWVHGVAERFNGMLSSVHTMKYSLTQCTQRSYYQKVLCFFPFKQGLKMVLDSYLSLLLSPKSGAKDKRDVACCGFLKQLSALFVLQIFRPLLGQQVGTISI